MTRIPTKQTAVRFFDGDIALLRKLFPHGHPTTIIRDLVHQYVRQELSRRGPPVAVPAARSEEAAP